MLGWAHLHSLSNWLYNRLYAFNMFHTASCTTGCTTGCMHSTCFIQPVVQLVVQLAVCIQRVSFSQLYNWLYAFNVFHTASCTTGCMHSTCFIQPVVQLVVCIQRVSYSQLYNWLYNWFFVQLIVCIQRVLFINVVYTLQSLVQPVVRWVVKCKHRVSQAMMVSSMVKRVLIYYWYNVRWRRFLLLLGIVCVAGFLFCTWLFPSQSHIQKSKYGVARYKVG